MADPDRASRQLGINKEAARTEGLPGIRRDIGGLLIGAVAVFTGLVAGGLLILATGNNPVFAYKALFNGALGSPYGIGESLVETMPLLLSGLAVALAFQGSLFNIGVEGQLAMGAISAAILGLAVHGLPPVVHITACLLVGTVAGAAWAAIPGYLKAKRGVHEVISTIMMNYIAFNFTAYLVLPGGPLAASDVMGATIRIENSATLPLLLRGTRLTPGILIAGVMMILVWFLLSRTRLGYRIRMVGKNREAAECAGINILQTMVACMTISGGLAGLAGALEITGVLHRFFYTFSPGYGFEAIAIALIGQLNPFGVSVAALLFGILSSGSVLMQTQTNVSIYVIQVFSGVIVIFIAAAPVIDKAVRVLRRYRPTG